MMLRLLVWGGHTSRTTDLELDSKHFKLAGHMSVLQLLNSAVVRQSTHRQYVHKRA